MNNKTLSTTQFFQRFPQDAGALLKAFVIGVVCAVMLASCGGSNNKKEDAPAPLPADAFKEGAHPRFDPVVSDLPFNTDLIFAKAAATDGTADVGTPSDAVRTTLNGLDGFSTSAFFDVMVDGSVDPTTAVANQTVFLMQLDTGTKDALDPANIVGVKGPATFDVKVVSLDGGTNNVIRLRPTLPLKSKAKYLVFLTNGIKDSTGTALTRSWTYNALHDTTYPIMASLVPVRSAVVGWETLASAVLKAAVPSLDTAGALDKLILTYTFTTTDPQAPLIAMASPRALVVAKQVAAGVSAPTAIGAANALDAGGLLPTPKQRPFGVNAATGIDMGVLTAGKLAGNKGKLYTGYIKLPYYQTAADPASFGTFLKKNWTADLTLAAALGATVPADVDGATYNVTYRYPFAKKTTDEIIPLQITLPEKTLVSGDAGSATCDQIYGASGYAVVIYVHGITSDRTSGIGLAHSLASHCVITVAIDLPLHGVAANNAFVSVLNVEKSTMIPFATLYGANAPHERHFNVAGPGGAPAPMNFTTPSVNDGSGTQFTNLGYLLNTRDNNREAVIDLLNLNASLKGIDTGFIQPLGQKINFARVFVVGHSLGGILGSVFTTVNQAAIANDQAAGLTSNLNSIRGFVASTPGTQVSQVLVNSASFAPIINAGLAAAGVNVGTSNYEKFMYAAQSAVDSGDPVNFLQLLSTLNMPVLVQQVKNDLVIPNSAASAPLTGTEAFARLLSTTQLGLGQTTLGRGFVKLNAGDHASVLRPTDTSNAMLALTGEMQAQVVTFVLTNGSVTVGAYAPTNIEGP